MRRAVWVPLAVGLALLAVLAAATGARYYARWSHETGPGNPDFTTSNRLLTVLKSRPLTAEEFADLRRVAAEGWWGPNRSLAMSVMIAAAEKSPEHRPAVRQVLTAAAADPDEHVRRMAAARLAKLPAE